MRLRASDDDGLNPIDRVLPKLQKVRKSGQGWTARCPVERNHKRGDHNPSLSVKEGDDGRILLNCHKGCAYKDIMTALGLQESDGFLKSPEPTPITVKRAAIVKAYDYHNERGDVLFQTVRYEPKDFRQRHPNGDGEWVWNLDGVRRVLYRLPELLAADPNVMVWLVEGEKDADYLASLGFLATTSPMGAKSWRPEYAELLHGRHVVIVPDKDSAGHEYAEAVFESLKGIAASQRILFLPELTLGGDVSDWLDSGHTADELATMAEAAEDSTERLHTDPRYTLHSAAEVFEPIPPIQWVVDNLLSSGSVSVLCGPPGSKKTYTVIDIAVCVALGKPWLGRSVTQGPVLLIDEESGNNRLRRRLFQSMTAHGAGPGAPIYWTTLEMFNLRNSDEMEHLHRLFGEVMPTLAVIDALADVMPGADENAVQDTHPVMQTIRSLAERHQCANVVLHHANKVGGYRGSSAIAGAVDLMLMVESTEESFDIKYKSVKCRDTEHQSFSAKLDLNVANNTAKLLPALRALDNRRALSEQHVINFIKDSGGSASVKDIKDNASACSPATAERAIYRLAAEGILRRIDDGKNGEKATYGFAAHITPEGYIKMGTSATSANLCNAEVAGCQTSATSASLFRDAEDAEVRLPELN